MTPDQLNPAKPSKNKKKNHPWGVWQPGALKRFNRTSRRLNEPRQFPPESHEQ